MKKMIKSMTGIGFIAGICFTMMSLTGFDGARIKVYLHNKCTSDVSIRIESPGSATTYSVEDGANKAETFMEGTKIYDSKGRVAHVISKSSEGKTIVVCE